MGKTIKAACLLALASSAAFAQTPITVANFNFGAPSVAEGSPVPDFTGDTIPGWTTSASADGSGGVYNPTTDQYSNPDILDAGATGGVIGSMGTGNNQALFLNGSSLTYQQILSDSVVPGMTYNLTVAVGVHDNGDDFGGYIISLGSVGTGNDDGFTETLSSLDSPGDGTFTDVTLTWTAPDTAGGSLFINLGSTPLGDVDYTNVRLEAVPEASTWAAIGFAGAVGVSVAWRRRRGVKA